MNNWERTSKKWNFDFNWGYDSDIKFFFRITKLHGIEIAVFNRLFSVRYKKLLKSGKPKELKILGLKFIYWGRKYKDTYLSIDTKKTRYVFGLRHFKYYGTANVADLV